MEIENVKETTVYKIQRISYAIVLGGWVMLLFYLYPLDEPVFGISKWFMVGVPLVAYLLFLFYHYMIDASYVYFTVEKGVIIFRYFSMRMLGEERKSIEIGLDALINLTVEKSFFNKRWRLILHQRIGSKVAKYPPISVSLLGRTKRDKLLHVLNSVIIKNKGLG
ncbi:MAG TPA: hypothetical protein VMW01_03220 [Williamwhitmania sp.]|jgi:hypothetical protein|nr:hypothetical protein [Williamwhitmania sp.]